MVSRVDWGGKRERELQKGRCRRKGAGWLRKGFGFKRSPPPDQTRPRRHGRTLLGGLVWACGLWALWAGRRTSHSVQC